MWAVAGEKALSETLRRIGGCPGIADLADAVVAGSKGSDESWAVQADAAVQRAGYSQALKIAREVADAYVQATTASVSTPDGALATGFVVEFLRRLVLQQGFGPIQATLASDRFSSAAELIDWEEGCLNSMRLRPIAEKLLANPNAARLRAPSTRTKHRSTAQLLHRWP